MLSYFPQWQGLVLLVLYVVAHRCMASSADDLCKAVALAVDDALNAAHIDRKVAAPCMGLTVQRLSLQLQGHPEQPLALWRLMQLPFTFWLHFAPWLIYRVTQQRMQEIAESVRS